MLEVLLDRPGEVISRETVRHQLWPANTFVDFDAGLNSAAKKLRDALGDPAENSQFIETVPRRGYRFIAPVHQLTADEERSREPRAASAGLRVRPRWIVAAVLIVILLPGLAVVHQRGWWQRVYPGTSTAGIRALAVLPFQNLTGDPAQDYLADAMTDALTTTLAQAGGFHVVSRTSATLYRSAKKSLPAIAQELNVDAVLEGSVVRSGQNIRVTTQLIDAATDRHMWARSFESEANDVVGVQRQVATAIAAALGSRLASSPSSLGGGLRYIDPDAYDAYLKGLFAGGYQTYQGFRTAVGYFENAISKQPDFAAAYAALAQAQHQFVFTGPQSPRESIPKAEAAARKALELDDTIAQAHRTLGAILQSYHWQWEEGDKEFRRARELDGHGTEHQSADTASLIRLGRFEEAIAGVERARNRDPLSFNAYINVATAYRAAGHYDRAIAEIRRALEITPGRSRAHFQLGVTFLFMGRLQEAIDELDTAVRSSHGGNPRFEAYLGYTYAATGRRDIALKVVQDLEARAQKQYVSSFGIALIHDALGHEDAALDALERAYRDRAVEFSQMSQYPSFRTISAHPRYHAVMQLVGLPRF